MHYIHIGMDDTQTEIKAMDNLSKDVKNVPFNGTSVFAYSQSYVWWETNRVGNLKRYS